MLIYSLRSVFWGIILSLFILNPRQLKAQETDAKLEKESIAQAIDSIFNLEDTQLQFSALLALSRRNAWRMNPFTVQYLDNVLNKLSHNSPLVPAAVNFLFGEFLNVNLQQFRKSLFFYKKAIEVAPAEAPELQLRIWERISALSLHFSQLEDAIPATDSCIVKAGQQQAWFTLAHCLKCKGDIRRDYFQEAPHSIAAYWEALSGYKRSFRDNVEQKDTLAALLNLFFISSIYLDIDSSYQQAGVYIDTAFRLITEAPKFDDFRAQNSFLRGKLLTEQRQYADALEEFTGAFKQFAVNKDTARLSQTGYLVGKIHFQQADYALAISHLMTALELSPKVNSAEHVQDIQYLLYRSYQQIGEQEKALAAHEAYVQAKDQINQIDQLHLLAAMEAERGLQDKQKEINGQQIALEKQDFINRFLLAGTLLLSTLLALLLFSFIRIRKARNELAVRNALISEQKQELEALDNLKSRFFTNISHELRTPLTLILAPVRRLLEKYRPAEEARTLLKTVEKNTLSLYQLIDELLDFSKIESGKAKLRIVAADPDRLLHQIIDGFLPLAEARRIDLQYHSELSGPVAAGLDQNAFQKILNNLLSNALKFSPEGSEVAVILSENQEQISICVRDNGPGIYPDDLPHIFERFYQSRHAYIHSDHSTGIGLALSAELAGLMLGKLWAESERGLGSRFYFEIPKNKEVNIPQFPSAGLVPETAGAGAAFAGIAPLSTHPAPEGKASSILIVEDHEDLRNYLAHLLGEYYRVFIASNGKEALQLLARPHSPLLLPGRGLIISDMMMPEMNGFELLEVLKSDNQYAGLPVIMLTALKNRSNRLKALTIGVDDYLGKPFDNQELLIRVRNLLNRSQKRGMQDPETSPAAGEEVSSEAEMTTLPDMAQLAWLKDLEAFSLKNISNSQFGVSFLSNYANMSERNFQRHIKKVTGMTPSEYIREIRLHQARELLETGRIDSVKAASKAVGFIDQEYFSTLFQGRFGRKPSTYLENYR